VYDDLQEADAIEFLQARPESFDLVVAADVFIYIGALEQVFALLAQGMQAGGTFCFTVEEAHGTELQLRASLRYAHSEAYVRRLASANGFAVGAMERRAVREEQRQPIPGLFFWLQRS
jgi:predicted TPR repeat methyltransferase